MLMLQEKADLSKCKVGPKDFKDNRSMLNKNVLRYCETFCAYCNHIQEFFNDGLNQGEMRILLFLLRRIVDFLKDAPTGGEHVKTIARYSRLLGRLEKIEYNELKKGENHE